MIPLTMEAIDAAFEGQDNQWEVFLALYRIVYPDFDRITRIEKWPLVSETTHDYILSKFIAFDQKHHPDVISGGLWFNQGFEIDRDLPDWMVQPVEVAYVRGQDV